jgi:hypothetical protein
MPIRNNYESKTTTISDEQDMLIKNHVFVPMYLLP